MQSDHTSIESGVDGERIIPWPSQTAEKSQTCCVALRVQVTQDEVDRDVEVLHDLPRVGFGDPRSTMQELIEYRLEGPARTAVLDEIDAIGPIHPPLLLERMHEGRDGICVHLEALLLPTTRDQWNELDQLIADETDPAVCHGLGWEWAEDLQALWRAAAPTRRLPIRYLEDEMLPSATGDGRDGGAARVVTTAVRVGV